MQSSKRMGGVALASTGSGSLANNVALLTYGRAWMFLLPANWLLVEVVTTELDGTIAQAQA